MNARQLSRYFQAARKDRRGNFREYFRCPNNTQVLCESESEYRLWESFTEGLETKQIDLNRVSVRGLFEEFIPGGREIVYPWSISPSIEVDKFRQFSGFSLNLLDRGAFSPLPR